MSADELKAKGNAAFSAGKYEEAISHFSAAIDVDPSNHVLYSNRSAAEASLKNYEAALEDAKKCVSLKPEWGKGYSRLGAAYCGLEEWKDAIEAYETGLKHDPSSDLLKTALSEAQAAAAAPPLAKSPFSRPEFLAKLAMDPRTRAYLGQPDFMAMLQTVQRNPGSMNMYLGDPRFQVMLELAFGFKFGGAGGEEEGFATAGAAKAVAEAAATAGGGGAAHAHAHAHDDNGCCVTEEASSHATPMETEQQQGGGGGEADEAKELKKKKAEALREKELGNESYKKKDFPTAIEHYNKAMELDDTDISFITNRSAVYFEMKDYDKCIEDCDKALERGREVRADFKLLAKALTRKGSALVQLGRLDEAVQIYNKSLTEHRNPETLKKLHEAEKMLKDKKEKDYIDMEKSNAEKELGNQAFKDMKFPEAVQHYTEALRRGPPSVNPEAHKLYSNLAASYTKLVAYPEGLKAADKCIELAPAFAKGYSRKGTLQFFMKEYDKAVITYRQGLEFDPENQELKEGMERCFDALGRFASGQASEDEVKERQARSMADPEVQALLKDPVMQNVLRDFQEDPRAAQVHLKNPGIMAKLNKLIAAGIIQVK